MAAVILSVMLVVLLGIAAMTLLVQQFSSFLKEWPAIQSKMRDALDSLSIYLSDNFVLNSTQQNAVPVTGNW